MTRYRTILVTLLLAAIGTIGGCACCADQRFAGKQEDVEMYQPLFLDGLRGFFYIGADDVDDNVNTKSINVRTNRLTAAGYGTAIVLELLEDSDRVYFIDGDRVDVHVTTGAGTETRTISTKKHYVEVDNRGLITVGGPVTSGQIYDMIKEMVESADAKGVEGPNPADWP